MREPDRKYDIKRYDLAIDPSLKSYSAADEYLLQDFIKLGIKSTHLGIYNDRFGFLTCHLRSLNPRVILTHKSQEKAIHSNIKANGLALPEFSDPLSSLPEDITFALIKIPKSLALFQLFLEQIVHNSTEEVTISAAFMTRHFSPKIVEIAQRYFEDVEQSRAVKKARLITLKKKKHPAKLDTIETLIYKDQAYQQYWGVFSVKHIDYATQYFLAHLKLKSKDQSILDLASGNGIIGKEIAKKLPHAEVHLLDDAYLAVESGKLNIKGQSIHHHFQNDLSIFEEATFDLIVTNPPFHFEHEINVKIPLQLFNECFRCLKMDGSLQIVANKHLNYKTQLTAIFPIVEVLAQNDKYVVYKCLKSSNA